MMIPTSQNLPLMEKLRAVKKPELHLHFRGCLEPDLLHKLMIPIKKKQTFKDHGLLHRFPPHISSLITGSAHVSRFLSEWERHSEEHQLQRLCHELWEFPEAHDFFMTYLMTAGLFEQPEDLFKLSDHVINYLEFHNIIYSEIIFSVSEYMLCGWSVSQVSQLLSHTKNKAADKGLQIQWIFDFVRDFGEKSAISLMEQLLGENIDGWVAITLGGQEAPHPAKNFRQLYKLAAESDLGLSCHAGEHASHQSVADAVELLGCVRIGHGLTSYQSEQTMNLLKSRDVTLEVCPTSNVKTLAISQLKDHPAYKMHCYGVPITIASDDPGFFQTSLTTELYRCITVLGFQWEDILATIRRGFQASFTHSHGLESV